MLYKAEHRERRELIVIFCDLTNNDTIILLLTICSYTLQSITHNFLLDIFVDQIFLLARNMKCILLYQII